MEVETRNLIMRVPILNEPLYPFRDLKIRHAKVLQRYLAVITTLYASYFNIIIILMHMALMLKLRQNRHIQ